MPEKIRFIGCGHFASSLKIGSVDAVLDDIFPYLLFPSGGPGNFVTIVFFQYTESGDQGRPGGKHVCLGMRIVFIGNDILLGGAIKGNTKGKNKKE
jgi:hypothetical protein